MIRPTVGRVVWFYPHANDSLRTTDRAPLAAIVARVWSDAMVNLAVFSQNGDTFPRTSIPLVQEGGEVPDSSYCAWMPYQKGQAAKTEQLQQQLGEKAG